MKLDLLNIWIVAGIFLLILEMVTASFFLVFIAFGCFAAALAYSVGLAMPFQFATCAVVSIVGATTLRKPIMSRLSKAMKHEADLGKELRSDQAIEPHKQARISYQGSTWLATNVGIDAIATGDYITIVGMDGNVLLVRKSN